MDVSFALLADAVNISREGKLNILGNFSEIYAKSFPANHAVMELVIRLDASPVEAGQEKKLELTLSGPDGERIGEPITRPYTVPTPSKPGRRVQAQILMKLYGVQFPEEGDYGLTIMINGETKASVPIYALRLPEEGVPSGS